MYIINYINIYIIMGYTIIYNINIIISIIFTIIITKGSCSETENWRIWKSLENIPCLYDRLERSPALSRWSQMERNQEEIRLDVIAFAWVNESVKEAL